MTVKANSNAYCTTAVQRQNNNLALTLLYTGQEHWSPGFSLELVSRDPSCAT